MRYGIILPILASALLAGCFPRLADYGDGPGPQPDQAVRPGLPGAVFLDSVSIDRLYAFITLTNPYLTPQVARSQAELIAKHSADKGVPVSLLVSLIATESSFNPRAVSPVGAQGLGQLMPATARDMGVNDPFDIEQNIQGTSRYMAWLGRYWASNPRRWELALASYLAGVGTVSNQLKAGRDLTNEQYAYVKKILQLTAKV